MIRAGILAAAAAGFCVALSSYASADIVEPKSAYQPASVALLDEEAAQAIVAEHAEAGVPVGAEAAVAEVEEVEEVVLTPVPEQVVRRAPAHMLNTNTINRPEPSVAERAVGPLRVGFRQIGASLGRVVGACDVGFGLGSGGPVLIFAVMSMVAPFIRRRVFATRRTADDDVPEFLFAQELTPPG